MSTIGRWSFSERTASGAMSSVTTVFLRCFARYIRLSADGQGIADGDADGHHAADAGRDVHLLELGQMGREEALVDVLELAHESLSRDVGQDEQQLVAAVPHQHIGGADAAVDDGDDEPGALRHRLSDRRCRCRA